jgi:hypothetical protein
MNRFAHDFYAHLGDTLRAVEIRLPAGVNLP